MDEVKYRRIRQLILDSTHITGQAITFDTDNAGEKGYNADEITIAEQLLANNSFYTTDFLAKIREIYGDNDYKPHIYFVEFAKIIFVIDRNNQTSMYFFEEDFEKMVLFKKYVGICDNFL